MGTISISLPSDGTTADVADVNTPLTTIQNVINGNLDSNNLASNAVTTAKITDDSITFAKVAAGFPVQMASVGYSAVATGTTLIPLDDTIPQITEGTEFMTLAITPKSVTNKLIIEVTAYLSSSGSASIIGAIFQDSSADALAAGTFYESVAGGRQMLRVRHTMTAGTTSATTFKFRAGSETAGGAATTTFNGGAGARQLGATIKSSIVITEYKA